MYFQINVHMAQPGAHQEKRHTDATLDRVGVSLVVGKACSRCSACVLVGNAGNVDVVKLGASCKMYKAKSATLTCMLTESSILENCEKFVRNL